MRGSTFLLSVVPPLFAMAVEFLDFINEKMLERQIAQLLDKRGLKNKAIAIEDLTKLTSGAVEVAGLGPTILACLMSGIGVINELPLRLAYAADIVYVIIWALFVILIVRFVIAANFYDLAVKRIIVERLWRSFDTGRSGKEMVSSIIFTANIILIVVCCIVYFMAPMEPSDAACITHERVLTSGP